MRSARRAVAFGSFGLLTASTASSLSGKMRHAPSADRNKGPISDALKRYPPWSEAASSNCLELASGTGQHAAFLARSYPAVTMWPTEYGGSASPESSAHDTSEVFASIVAYCSGLPNVRRPVELDAGAATWPDEIESNRFQAVYACNVCHISPFAVTEGLLRGAARVLAPGGGLFIYGPFKVNGKHTAESNEAFDARLRANDAAWGVRDSTELELLGEPLGLRLVERVPMPANNFLLYFVRAADARER